MLLQPMAENTLKFLQNLSIKNGKDQGLEVTLKNPVDWLRVAPRFWGLFLLLQEPALLLIWSQKFSNLSLGFSLKI